MKAIIGTAGHIDHGKTALVAALTGIDTDRLPEERARGISIELGFAHLDLPDGSRVGIVDVPGHERFIRQMLAGAHGFDLMVLVIAADDGIMPQTEEHFEICHLLGVRAAIIAMTKVDLVAEERIAELRSDIEVLVAGTRFEHSPVVAVSARDGTGLDDLRARLVESLGSVGRGSSRGAFRMPVDRSFLLKGHGLVVTGTAVSGRIAVGDELVVLPRSHSVRVREIQVHGSKRDGAEAGQRVALNVVGADRTQITRGDCLVAPGVRGVTSRFDARIEIRPSAGRPVKSHQRVRVYLGTRETAGRIVLLGERVAVEPRSSCLGQVVLDEPCVAFCGDRFVLRDETARRTLGGGKVLLAAARRHKRSDADAYERLGVLDVGGPVERLEALAELTANFGLTVADAAVSLGIDERTTISIAGGCDALTVIPDTESPLLIASERRRQRYSDELVESVRSFHAQNRSLPGVELESLRSAAGADLDLRVFRAIVDDLVAAGRLCRRGSIAYLPSHRVAMSEGDESLALRVLAEIRTSGATPPTVKELAARFGCSEKKTSECIGVLAERGEVIRVSAELAYESAALSEIERRLRAFFARSERITAAEFRDLLTASRKYSIPVLDYFDRTGVTIRVGDHRRLRVA